MGNCACAPRDPAAPAPGSTAFNQPVAGNDAPNQAPAIGLSRQAAFSELTNAEAAAKLDFLVGTTVHGSDETKTRALLTLDAWFRTRIPRSISKKVDLVTSVAHDGTMDAALKSALSAAIEDKACLSSLMSALDTLHERWAPKQSLGFAGLLHKMGEHKPWRYAYEQGCRMYDVPIPFPPDIVGFFNAIGMGEEFKMPESANFAEFDGCDMSDVNLTMNSMPMVMSGQEHTVGPHVMREDYDRLRKLMAPFEKEHGLPLIDTLLIKPFAAFVVPDFKGIGCFSDWWREAEKLVDEGLVRSLAVDSMTIHQIESILKIAKHRPVMASFETHILAPMPEMVAFLKENRIVPRAIVALCKGEVLESEGLKRSDMTPAQAALRWHIQQGVTPCFGNDTLAHIDENFKAQTAELMGLPPVVAPKPARNNLKLYPMMAMNMPGMTCHNGTREDEGIFREDMDGRLWFSSTRAAGDKWADQVAKMSDGEENLIREIEAAIGGIKRDMKSGHERRMSIAAAIAGLGKPVEKGADEKIENLGKAIGEAKEAAAANGSDVHDEMGKNMDAFHSISGDSGAKGLVEMVVVPMTTFISEKQIPRRSYRNTKEYHVPATALGPDDKVLFFSQRWLTPSPRSAASPDDAPGGTKYKQLMAACNAYMKSEGVAEKNLYIWLDYSSVDQDDDTLLVKGVNSLALYVCSCDAFISIDHADYFDRGWCLMECMFADCSKTPRYIFSKEDVLKVLTPDMKLENKTPTEGSFTVESDRAIMKVLSLVANSITAKIDRGGTFSVLAVKDAQASKELAAKEQV